MCIAATDTRLPRCDSGARANLWPTPRCTKLACITSLVLRWLAPTAAPHLSIVRLIELVIIRVVVLRQQPVDVG
eukprot:COSAG04_NODE_7695_length_1085_cov_38.100406_1_plen_73_part_10